MAIYVRNSDNNEQLIQEQLNHLRAVCKAEDKVISHEFIDIGFSGKSADHPSLQDLLLKAGERSFDELKVVRISHLSRDMKNFVKIVRGLQSNGISIHSDDPSFDLSSSIGRVAFEMMAATVEIEEATQGSA